ncbi:MAG: hypothetical protein ACJ8D5_00020 [Sphingomicrobium sp.]
MTSQSKIRRKTLELHPPARPSRIRRDPLHVQQDQQLARNAWWNSREWEIRLSIAGIVFFALAISALVIDLGEVLGR